jgi:hemolysin activation/secretion protein
MSQTSSFLRNLVLTGGLSALVGANAVAATQLPGSVAPGRIQQEVVPLSRAMPVTQIHYAQFPTTKIEWQAKKWTPRLRRVLVRNQGIAFPSQVANIYRPYVGYLLTTKNVAQLADAIAQFYRQQGYFAAQVVVPEQNLHNGVLELTVYEGAVSEIQINNKNAHIQAALQHYADEMKKLNPVRRTPLERDILLAGELKGVYLTADVGPDLRRPGCAKVILSADLQQVGIDLGYDNYGVRWQGSHQYAANVFGNSLIQAGDHTQVNAMMSTEGKDLRYFAAEHSMPIGYSGTRLQVWGNYAQNEPGFTLNNFDMDGKAASAGIFASHPLLLTLRQQLWARLGVRFTDEEVKLHDRHYYVDKVRVLEASADYGFNDCWQGQTRAKLIASHGFDILGAQDIERAWHSLAKGVADFTKVNGEVSYTRPLVDNFSFMVGGLGQYGFNPLVVSELMGLGGRFWGRAYDWSDIMGDTGVVGTVELRYDTKPGAPEHKNTQYFLAYDAGEVWARYAPDSHHRRSLTSLQAGLRLDFTRFLSADLVIAKPLTRDVLAEDLAGHHGDRIRAFFRIALHA